MLNRHCFRSVINIRHIASVMLIFLIQSNVLSSLQLSVSEHCRSCVYTPKTDSDAYVQHGDLNIGGYIIAPSNEDPNFYNLTKEYAPTAVQMSEAIAYAVNQVNEDPHLLPNVSLGFILVHDGLKPHVALANTFQFLPRMTCQTKPDGACFCSSLSEPPVNNSRDTDHHLPRYDIIGAISPVKSSITVPVSYVFSAAKIPLISSMSSSDELSDNSRHPYFLRVTPPSRFETKAILEFIHGHGWSYISILYNYGPFGEIVYTGIIEHATRYNICIATSHNVQASSDFDHIVSELLQHINARVVILLITSNEVLHIFDAVNRHNASGYFVWIGGDALTSSTVSFHSDNDINWVGSFILSYQVNGIYNIYERIINLGINSTTNPWFKQNWELMNKSQLTEGMFRNDSKTPDVNELSCLNFTSLYVDAVMVFAHAVTKLLAERCPGLTGAQTKGCIRGEELLKYMKNVSFEGYSGHIQFDKNGDIRGKYNIWQIAKEYKNTSLINSSTVYSLVINPIALYDMKTKHIVYTGQNISWNHMATLSRTFHPLIKSTEPPAVPESVCSKPCLPGEYIMYLKPDCCWQCRKCGDNERLVNQNTTCEQCQLLTWPDPETGFTTCRDISVTLSSLHNTVVVIVMSLGVLAAVGTGIVCVGLVHFRDFQVFKASSRELSFLQLGAVAAGCFSVVLLQLPPTDRICGAVYFTFSLSFAGLYSSLLIKSLHIYRTFLGGTWCGGIPPCTSRYSQIVMTMILICIQINVCVITYIIYQPNAKKSQPVAMEKYVELACDMTLPGLVSFLVYNLVLVFTCSVLAFKTRKLPNNFNEPWHIFMCAATTIIIWLGFVPTYFTASLVSVKSFILSLAILLNHTAALVFLFLPKIYAAIHACAGIKPQRNCTMTAQQPSTSKY